MQVLGCLGWTAIPGWFPIFEICGSAAGPGRKGRNFVRVSLHGVPLNTLA